MSLLSEYKLTYEVENAKTRTTKNPTSQDFKADQGARLGSLAGSLVSRLFANRKRSARRSHNQ
jgi:hypothetical protein